MNKNDLLHYNSQIRELSHFFEELDNKTKLQIKENKQKQNNEEKKALLSLTSKKDKLSDEFFINLYLQKNYKYSDPSICEKTENVISVLNNNSRKELGSCLSPYEVNFNWTQESLDNFEIHFHILISKLATSVQNKCYNTQFQQEYKRYLNEIKSENHSLYSLTENLYHNLCYYSDRWNCFRVANAIAQYAIIKNIFLKQKIIMDNL